MARIRTINDKQITSAPAYDDSRFRVCVVWSAGRANFTYHHVASPKAAAHYIRLPGPTEGSMAVFFQELEDGVWEDWYHPEESLELEECIEEGVAL